MANKNTKQALISSVIALFLCFAMLFGTTFAWFTDEVVNTNNVIKTGTLEVKLEHKTLDQGWAELTDGSASVFNYGNWEPGYTDVHYFKVTNIGSLAFKYTMAIVPMGDALELAKVIDVYYAASEVAIDKTKRSLDGLTRVGTLEEVLDAKDGTVIDDYVLADAANPANGESDTATIVLKMQESAGNEYQEKYIGGKNDGFKLHLLATQFTSEKDSFDENYDKDSQFPAVITATIDSTTTAQEIKDIFALGGGVRIAESVDLTDPENGYTYITTNANVNLYLDEDTVISFNETAIINGTGSITVHGGSLETPYELCVAGDATLIIEDGVHNLSAFSASSNGTIIVNGGTLNCEGDYAGILGITFGENGSLIVNDGVLNMYQPFNLNANRCDNAYIEINGGTINLIGEADKLFAVRNVMAKDREPGGVLRGSSVKITGGVFTAEYEMDSSGDANAFIRNEDGNCDTNRVLISNAVDGYNCVVTGGTFYDCWTRTGEGDINGDKVVNSNDVAVNSIEGFVADGYEMTGDEVNGYVVTKQ